MSRDGERSSESFVMAKWKCITTIPGPEKGFINTGHVLHNSEGAGAVSGFWRPGHQAKDTGSV